MFIMALTLALVSKGIVIASNRMKGTESRNMGMLPQKLWAEPLSVRWHSVRSVILWQSCAQICIGCAQETDQDNGPGMKWSLQFHIGNQVSLSWWIPQEQCMDIQRQETLSTISLRWCAAFSNYQWSNTGIVRHPGEAIFSHTVVQHRKGPFGPLRECWPWSILLY